MTDLAAQRKDLIESLQRHRGFLLQTADGLSDEQARTASTVSALTIAGVLKHVADTEEQWFRFVEVGAEAFAGYIGEGMDYESFAAEVDSAEEEWVDERFVLSDEETLEVLIARVKSVAARSEEILAAADLDLVRPLPQTPWYEPGTAWSARRVAIHMLAEISQHAGHADIIREAIDGQKTMG